MPNLDVLIVGGYYGVGRRGGMISHFLCAAAAPPKKANDHPSVFYSFCKVGSGYSLKELAKLCDTLNPHWRKFDSTYPPENILFSPGFKEKPDVWIEPSKSKIVQIKAAEITQSEKYKCGFTLRFPRVESIREDKSWYDCMHVDEIENLREISDGHLANKNIADDAEGQPSRKKRRVARVDEAGKVADHLKGADISSIKKESRLLEGHEFCIMSGSSDISKHELERKITQHGGKFIQNPGNDTYCVVADRLNVRVKNVIRGGRCDVVRVSWLLASLESGELLKFKPRDMVFSSEMTRRMFLADYDNYGDSFVEDIEEDDLRRVFKSISAQTNAAVLDESIAEIEHRYFPNDSHLGIFRRCRAYFDKWCSFGNMLSGKSTSNLDVIELDFKFHGGRVTDVFDKNVTHVILDKRDTSRLPEIREGNRYRSRKAHIVTGEWISHCIDKKSLAGERLFEPI